MATSVRFCFPGKLGRERNVIRCGWAKTLSFDEMTKRQYASVFLRTAATHLALYLYDSLVFFLQTSCSLRAAHWIRLHGFVSAGQ